MHQSRQGYQGGLSTRRARTLRRTSKRTPPLEQWNALRLVRALQREDACALRAVRLRAQELATLAERLAATLRSGGRLIYVGAGTSGRLGMLDAVELPPTFGISPHRARAVVAGGHTALWRAVEGAEDDSAAAVRALRRLRVGKHDLVMGISASGTTPFVLGALSAARRSGAYTVLLCCRHRSRSPAKQLLVLDTGEELLPGSTRLKAGTATKLALNAISTAALVRLGHVYLGQMVDLLPTNRKLRERAIDLVKTLGDVSRARAIQLLAQVGGAPRPAIELARARSAHTPRSAL